MRRIFFYTFLFNTILVYAQCVGDDCNYTIQSVASYGNFCLPVSATYSVFFEDNFDGTQLDLSKWNPRYGVIRDPNHITEKQWYTSNNLTVENGVLKIKIKKEVPPIFGHNDLTGQDEMFDYSSGEIDSKLSFGYGRYEIKCKVAVGRGFFPAFWMYGGGDAGLANEMDVFEFNNNNFSNQLTTLHLWDNGTNNTCQMPCGGVNNGFDFSQWHIFTFDWTPTYVRWLVDGVAVRIDAHYTDLNNAPVCDVKPNTPYKVKNIYADPNIPVNIIANVALQMGTYAPDNSTPFPSEMDIDYVRYYKLGCGNELSCYPTSGTPSPIFQNLGGRDTPPYAPVLRITNLNNCSTAYL
ncbi:MAG: glycoside hydrolase family 16 protein [Bacteroidia bacterium]|nr:glycoside hydrolase family 16 protein [Bacteroidia bacterium]